MDKANARSSMKNAGTARILGLSAVVAALTGCGGAAVTASTGSGGTTAAPDAPRTSTGEVVSAEAQNYWRDGLAAFTQAESAGWNDDTCGDVTEFFDDAAEAQGGRFAEALYMAGLTRSRCNDRTKALEYYNRALSANNKFCKARVMIGLDQVAQNQSAAALQTFSRAVADDAQCTEGYVNLAALQRASGQATLVRDALNNLRRALAIDAQYIPAFNEMALLYVQEADRNPTEATQRLDLAAVVCSQAQSIIRQMVRDLGEARRTSPEASRLQREASPIFNTMGLIYVKRGNIIEAVKSFQGAKEADAKNFEAWMNFGSMVLGFRGYPDAKDAFEHAIALDPRSYEAHLGLGAALRGLSEFDAAVAEYNKAKEIDGTRPEAFFNLALINHNYRGGSEQVLNEAKAQYEAFVAKAGSNARFADAVASVTRRCNLERARRGRRRSTSQCRPGFIQQIEIVATTRAEMAELQRQQQEMMARMAAQQGALGAAAAAPTPAPEAAPAPAPAPEGAPAPATP
jgi:tetratricopeptide (TPR) repeat protein